MKTLAKLLVLLALAATPALADSQGAGATPGTAGTQSTAAGCVYASSPATASSGQQRTVGCDSGGDMNVNVKGGGLSLNAATHTQSASTPVSNLVVKNTAGTLYAFTVTADSTLYAATWYVMIFDAAALPIDGAVTPAKCYQVQANNPQISGAWPTNGSAFTAGIVIGVSTTGCFTKTASAHATFIGADYQ